jgi:mRNA export factor
MLNYGNQAEDNSLTDVNIGDNNYPLDTVTDIQYPQQGQYAQNQSIFSVTGWDAQLRVYEMAQKSMNEYILAQRICINLEEPQLSSVFSPDGNLVATGGISGTLRIIDLSKGQAMVFGKHDKAISKVFWCVTPQANVIASCGYDGLVKFWTTQNSTPVLMADIKQRIFTADLREDVGILSVEDDKLGVFSMDLIFQNRTGMIKFNKNPLESQGTAVTMKTVPNGMGAPKKEMAIGSFDGRGNISKMEPMHDGNFRLDNVMTFKCHRVDKAVHPLKQDVLYPVHAIGFNPRSNHFIASCGGDGTTNYWDYVKKNKAKGFTYNKVPVTAARISPQGHFMAYALGYDWSMGVWGLDSVNYRPRVAVHSIQDVELEFRG